MVEGQMQSPPVSVAALRQDVVGAAEAKLGRSLTESERQTVTAFSSPRMLQSMHRSFANEATTAATVERDLSHLASLVG